VTQQQNTGPSDPIFRLKLDLRMSRRIGWIAVGIGIGNIHNLGDFLRVIGDVINALPQ
jgi:hypothetical protein